MSEIENNSQVILTTHSQLSVLKSNNMLKLNELESRIGGLCILAQEIEYEKIKEKLEEIVPEYMPMEMEVSKKEKSKSYERPTSITNETQAANILIDVKKNEVDFLAKKSFDNEIVEVRT